MPNGGMNYNTPAGTVPGPGVNWNGFTPAPAVASNVGPQFNTFFWERAAIIEERKVSYLGQLADLRVQPKHYGKEIKVYRWIPILDDRNVGTEGIDAAGAVGAAGQNANGNLYASSKDIGTIVGKFPTLTENGGRVNKVGVTKVEQKGSIYRAGMFTEFTDEMLDFDTEANLMEHIYREMGRAKGELDEDILAIELIRGAGITRFGGAATQDSEVTGEGGTVSVPTYNGIRAIVRELNNNRCPVDTTMITGSRFIDTKTVPNARYAYCDDSVRVILEDLRDNFGERAWDPVEKYAAAGTIAMGEVGRVDKVRFIEHPELPYDEGKGAAATAANLGYAETGGNYDVHHLLFIGKGSFTTIGFNSTDGKGKFQTIIKMPGRETADRTNPFGTDGFYSMQWWRGTMVIRSEWIADYRVVGKN